MGSPNLICIILRGGMDGLSAVTRPNDPELLASRSSVMSKNTLSLTDGFALHPVLKNIHGLFHAGELSFMHACGLPFRDRSHFKSQDILESGLKQAHPITGWLGRAMENSHRKLEAVAYGSTVPLLLKGSASCFNWSNPKMTTHDDRVLEVMRKQLYDGEKPLITAMQQENRLRELISKDRSKRPSKDPFEIIGSLVAKANGPDIGVISMTGWDTHDDQARRIRKELIKLDTGVGTLREYLKDVWHETVIIIASEFGRSVRQNGTQGTDHGTGGVVFIAGGGVDGGQSLGEWPGLRDGQLYAGRDLFPANDIRDVFANVLVNHIGLPHRTITQDIFPDLGDGYNRLALLKSGLIA